MIYYITKWWITRGVVEFEGEMKSGYVTGKYMEHHFSLPDTEAFTTREAAVARVKQLAKMKIARMREQIEQIEKEWLT